MVRRCPETTAHQGHIWLVIVLTVPFKPYLAEQGDIHRPYSLWGIHVRKRLTVSSHPFHVNRKEGSIWTWMCLKHPSNTLWVAAKSLTQSRGLRSLGIEGKAPKIVA